MSHHPAAQGPSLPEPRQAFWTLLITGTLIWPAGAAMSISTPLAAGPWLTAAGFMLIALGMVAGFAGIRTQRSGS